MFKKHAPMALLPTSLHNLVHFHSSSTIGHVVIFKIFLDYPQVEKEPLSFFFSSCSIKASKPTSTLPIDCGVCPG